MISGMGVRIYKSGCVGGGGYLIFLKYQMKMK